MLFQGGEEGRKGCYSNEAAAAIAAVAAAKAAECAKGRPVPPQKMVDDELAEQEEELLQVGYRCTCSQLLWACMLFPPPPIITVTSPLEGVLDRQDVP